MAQVIAPEVWQEGIRDNRLLPNRVTQGMFTGSGCDVANNPGACRVWDIMVSDYITDYDDRRLNGLGGPAENSHGADGWGASAYGVFQDVRFESRVYTMGRHRSVAWRIFDEMQYAGDIGNWGDATHSNVITNGESLMKTAQKLSKARDLWQKQVLGPDMDKYILFAVLNGHMTGRWVSNTPDRIMDGDCTNGRWVAQPGMVQGQALEPRFAAIKGIEWDDENIPLLLQNIKVTWNDLFIPQENRVIYLDDTYEYQLLSVLTGKGVPATESAYSDIQNGSFTKLMGWDFNFEVPSYYWPKLYVDNNLNVVHSEDGATFASDKAIISTDHSSDGDNKLLYELIDASRTSMLNYVRTDWDPNHGFVKTLSNYPLGMPVAAPGYGPRVDIQTDTAHTGGESQGGNLVNKAYGATVAIKAGYTPQQGEAHDTNTLWVDGATGYPWYDYGGGIGLPDSTGSLTPFPDSATYPANPVSGQYQATGPDFGTATTPPTPGHGLATARQVIGMALYRPSAQLSQEYSSMVTDEGRTRGKFTECCMDVKYDAWVIENLSAGILPIFAPAESSTTPWALPVSVVSQPDGN